MDRNILILGAGTFAEVVAYMVGIEDVYGFAVTCESKPDTLFQRPVYHLDDLDNKNLYAIAAIMHRDRYKIVHQAKERGWEFTHVIANSADVAQENNVSAGCIICRNVTIDYKTFLDNHCIINRGATIGHHCHLKEFVTIGPGANIAGNVTIGSRATIGMGANIREGVTIGEWSTIGMGAAVLEDVPPFETWYGVPAKPDYSSTKLRIYRFICEFTKEKGYSPTYQEIEHNCNIGRNSIKKYLDRLADERKIYVEPGKIRGIVLL